MAEVKQGPEKYENDSAKGLSTTFDITPEWYVGFFYSDQFATYNDFISWAGPYTLPRDSNVVTQNSGAEQLSSV